MVIKVTVVLNGKEVVDKFNIGVSLKFVEQKIRSKYLLINGSLVEVFGEDEIELPIDMILRPGAIYRFVSGFSELPHLQSQFLGKYLLFFLPISMIYLDLLFLTRNEINRRNN